MTITWPDLDRGRWTWALRARAELRAELTGLADPDDVSGVAHVMLVGDTNAGKTTVLLCLLGVTDPSALTEAGKVLRAGRGVGRSATAAPIRYSWSRDPDKWLLIQGQDRTPHWLTGAEIESRLADYRSPSGDQITWRVSDPPLEIGLPDRMAHATRRRDLKILDFPGLHAADPQERRIARDLVARAAPGMSLIVIVQAAHRLADAMQEPAITDNPHLASWHDDPGRYRIVATRAFSAGTIRKDLAREFGASPWDQEDVARWMRRHVADQLAGSVGIGVDPEALKKIIFPIEVGESWVNMAREYKAYVGPTNELLLTELRETLEEQASEDGLYLSAPNLANHIASVVRRRQEERQRNLDALNLRCAVAETQITEAMRRLSAIRDRRDRADREAAAIRTDIAALMATTPNILRPAKPEMQGPIVRDAQERDQAALYNAATGIWETWRDAPGRTAVFPTVLPADFESRLRNRYSELADCCERCSHLAIARGWRGTKRPEDCYTKMTAAIDGMRTWIVDQLRSYVQSAVTQGTRQLRQAEQQFDLAQLHVVTYQATFDAAVAARDQAHNKEARERDAEEKDLRIARTVLAVHNRHNEVHIRELIRKAATATPDERGFLAVAVLRAVYDLNRMYERG